MHLPQDVAPGSTISAKQFNDLLRYVRSLRLRSGPGAIVNTNSGGTTILVPPTGTTGRARKSADLVHPFLITDTSTGGTATAQVRFGTVNDVEPTSLATDLALTSAAVWRIYLDATLSAAGAVTAAAIVAATGAQPADSDTHAYITLGLVTVAADGGGFAVTDVDQAATHSLRFGACGRVVTEGSVTTRGTYQFWGF